MMKDLWAESEGYLKGLTNFGTSSNEQGAEFINKPIKLHFTMCPTQLQSNVYVYLN